MAESVVRTLSLGNDGYVAEQLVSNVLSKVLKEQQDDSTLSVNESLASELTLTKKELHMVRCELESCRRGRSDDCLTVQKNTGQPRLDGSRRVSIDARSKLDVAYEQIAMLNTQMAHLYTELTFARTGSCRSNQAPADKQKFEASLHKRSEQIGVLVQDIRHLQADLEYHQDQMAEQRMQRDQESARTERLQQEKDALTLKLEDAELKLKHQVIDRSYIDSLKNDDPSSAVTSNLQVEHSRAAREAQKCARLNERLQKTLMTVESQRHKIAILEKQMQKAVRIGSFSSREKRSLPAVTPRK